MDSTQFPQFRKSTNGRNYYKISAPDVLEEIQVMGSRWSKYTLHASILPERNLIADLLNLESGFSLRISAEEYAAFEATCAAQLRMM